MIHGMLARTTAATMTPAPAVQRKAILLSVIAVRAVLLPMLLPLRAVIAVLRLLWLAAGDERRQAVYVTLVF